MPDCLITTTVPGLLCSSCGHRWVQRGPTRPQQCPGCRRYTWDRDRADVKATGRKSTPQEAELVEEANKRYEAAQDHHRLSEYIAHLEQYPINEGNE